jgi:hypothetical protein
VTAVGSKTASFAVVAVIAVIKTIFSQMVVVVV